MAPKKELQPVNFHTLTVEEVEIYRSHTQHQHILKTPRLPKGSNRAVSETCKDKEECEGVHYSQKLLWKQNTR